MELDTDGNEAKKGLEEKYIMELHQQIAFSFEKDVEIFRITYGGLGGRKLAKLKEEGLITGRTSTNEARSN